MTPKAVIAVSAFRDGTMDMRIAFKIPAKGVKDHDKTGSEVHGFVLFEKHAGNNTVYSMKKAVKERAVMQEKLPEMVINGKNTMPVSDIDQFKRHGGSALHGVEIPAGRTRMWQRKGTNFSFPQWGQPYMALPPDRPACPIRMLPAALLCTQFRQEDFDLTAQFC